MESHSEMIGLGENLQETPIFDGKKSIDTQKTFLTIWDLLWSADLIWAQMSHIHKPSAFQHKHNIYMG